MDVAENVRAGDPMPEEAMLWIHTGPLLPARFRTSARETRLSIFPGNTDLWDFQTLAVILNERTHQWIVSGSTRLNPTKGYYVLLSSENYHSGGSIH
jgi:hypothetical protein